MEGIEPEVERSLGALGVTEACVSEALSGEQLAMIVVKFGGLVAESAGDTLFGLAMTDSARLECSCWDEHHD